MEYFNFCKNWGAFVKFIEESWGTNVSDRRKYFRWGNWNNKYYDKLDIWTLHGICTNESEEAKDVHADRLKFNQQLNEKIQLIQKSSKVDLDQKYTCQIWRNVIDFKANLQCIKCQQIFCFNWLIKWLKTNTQWQCPHWRNKISLSSIFVNRRLESEIETILSVIDDQNEKRWPLHEKNWDIFCKNWNREIWSLCVINKIHKKHQIISIDDQRKSTLESAKEYTNSKESVVRLKNKEIKRLDKNKNLAEFIKNDLIQTYRDRIDSIDNEMNRKINDVHKQYSQKIKEDLKDWVQKEVDLNKFVENEDSKDLSKNTEAINILKHKKDKTVKAIDVIHKSKKRT